MPTLGCRPFTRSDRSNNAQPAPSLPLQEIQAALGQPAPVALVPLDDGALPAALHIICGGRRWTTELI
ncbi:MAG TPA: hypothetical protein VI248_29385 [Kineosporiaceae bacterium]